VQEHVSVTGVCCITVGFCSPSVVACYVMSLSRQEAQLLLTDGALAFCTYCTTDLGQCCEYNIKCWS